MENGQRSRCCQPGNQFLNVYPLIFKTQFDFVGEISLRPIHPVPVEEIRTFSPEAWTPKAEKRRKSSGRNYRLRSLWPASSNRARTRENAFKALFRNLQTGNQVDDKMSESLMENFLLGRCDNNKWKVCSKRAQLHSAGIVQNRHFLGENCVTLLRGRRFGGWLCEVK